LAGCCPPDAKKPVAPTASGTKPAEGKDLALQKRPTSTTCGS
jgi:hypothetical protein